MGDFPSKAAQSSEDSLIPKQIEERVSKSSLLLKEGDTLKKVTLTEKRGFNPEDPLENKFRLAQSQYLSVSGQHASHIHSIDYVENRTLMENFQMKKDELKSEGKDAKEYLLFHGTSDINVDSILKENFRMDYAGQHGQTYGAGIYFSEKTKIPNKYMDKGKQTLLLCRVLLGKEYLGEERDIPQGFDSKSVKPDQDQRACINIIKEVNQILPCFVLNLAPTDDSQAQPCRVNSGAVQIKKCKSCPMVFTNAMALLSHQKTHNQTKNQNEAKKVKVKKINEKRLLKELKHIQSDPPEGVTCVLEGDNIMVWKAVIFGPDQSDFKDGKFQLKLEFNGLYPYEPPVVKFLSPMFHPNIQEDTGLINIRYLNFGMLPASEPPQNFGMLPASEPPQSMLPASVPPQKDIACDNWSPGRQISDVLTTLRLLLVEPNLNCGYVVNSEAAQLFKGNRREYKKKAQESVQKSWST